MVIDFHSHILPGIDDGSKSCAMSLEMLKAMKEQGVDFVVASPHFYYLRQNYESFMLKRENSYKELQNAIFNAGLEEGKTVPKILLGSETAYAFEIEKYEKLDSLCIEGTNALILEMPFTEWSMKEIDALADIIYTRNLTIVIAHIERYLQVEPQKILQALFELPVYIQMNAGQFIPLFGRKIVLKYFKNNQAHLLGSDAHNMEDRAPNIDSARKIIKNKLGQEKLNEIDETGKKILNI